MLDLNILLRNLRELANEELQKNLWLYGNENQMSSFAEAICGVFDDARLTRALETGYLESNFSRELCQKAEKLDKLISQLDNLISQIPEDWSPEKIIEHPKMNAVRVLSGELLVLFEGEIARKVPLIF